MQGIRTTPFVHSLPRRFVWLLGFPLLILFALVGYSQLSASVMAPDLVRVTPLALQAPDREAAGRLFDRATNTQFSAEEATEVVAVFEAVRDVGAIKVFGSAPFILTVKADRGAGWDSVEGLSGLDLRTLGAGWHRFEATLGVEADRLQFVLEPRKGGTLATGLAEIEIWARGGHRPALSGRDLLRALGSPEPPGQVRYYSATPAQALLGAVDPQVGQGAETAGFGVDIPYPPHLIKRAWLTYELDGAGHWSTVMRRLNQGETQGGVLRIGSTGWSLQLEPIDPYALVQGGNRIEFEALGGQSSYGVRNLGVLVELDEGSNFIEGIVSNIDTDTNPAYAVRDGDLNSGWRPWPAQGVPDPYLTLYFDKPTQLEALGLVMVNSLNGRMEIEERVDGQWQALQNGVISGSRLNAGWNVLPLDSGGPIEGLRLNFKQGQPSAAEFTTIVPIGSGVGYSHGPHIGISYPDLGQFYGDRGHLRGFIHPADNGSGPAQLRIADQPVTLANGAFESSITKAEAGFGGEPEHDPWSVTVEARYPDGQRITRVVAFTHWQPARNATQQVALGLNGQFNPNANSGAIYAAYALHHDEAGLDLNADAMDEDPSTITISPLAREDLPPLDPGMTNVTRGPRHGYRFLPAGKKFKKKVRLSLPYDKRKLPPGMTEADVRTYYYDTELGRWVALEREQVDGRTQMVVSMTDHFTDMINATVTVPEHPQAASFNPTQIKDIKAADPGAGIHLIEPPQANNMGDARLSYPIEIPPGRLGMQPQLALQYNSSGGNGWTGIGWDLSLPSISVETRWGAPRFDPETETETYLLNGEMLVPVLIQDGKPVGPAHRSLGVARNKSGTREFTARVEGSFRKIIRHGTDPKDYRWEVIDKNGTRHLYGGNTPADRNGRLGGDEGIFTWMLRETVDPYDNYVLYTYATVCHTGTGDGNNDNGDHRCNDNVPVASGYQLYPSEIRYTGNRANKKTGGYVITFTRDRQLGEHPRPDVVIDARSRFKQVTAQRLRRITIAYQETSLRSYELEYEQGTFGKTRLKTLTQKNATGQTFYSHAFDYYDELPNATGGYEGFANVVVANAHDDDLADRMLGNRYRQTLVGGGYGESLGANGFIGIGPPGAGLKVAAGKTFSASSSWSDTRVVLMDIDGDGLPDKVYKGAGGLMYRRNETPPGATTLTFSAVERPVAGLNKLPRSTTRTTGSGKQGYAFNLSGFREKSKSTTMEKSYFSDVNGDGIVDYVDNGLVRFGYRSVLDDQTVIAFSTQSGETDNPISGGTISAEELMAELAGEKARLEEENPLMDAVRRWEAPYDGTVRIDGTIQLHDYANDPSLKAEERTARTDYETADGVRVAIQKKGLELLAATIAADDHTVYTLETLGALAEVYEDVSRVRVDRGDVLYFRVQSRDDGSYDRINWSPTITYVDSAGTDRQHLDANNLNVFHYDAGADGILAGQSVAQIAPYEGRIRFEGSLQKARPVTDDVVFSITVSEIIDKGNDTYEEVPRAEGRYTYHMAADASGPFPLEAELDVKATDKISIRFEVDSPIDLASLQWADMPRFYYIAAKDPSGPIRLMPEDMEVEDGDDVKLPDPGDLETVGTFEGNDIEVMDEHGEPTLKLPIAYDMDIYAGNDLKGELQSPWVAPREGVVFVAPTVQLRTYPIYDDFFTIKGYETKAPDGQVVFTVKRRGRLDGKHIIEVKDGQVVESTIGVNALVALDVAGDDELYFDFTVSDPELAAEIAGAKAHVRESTPQGWQAPVSDTVEIRAQYKGYVWEAADDDTGGHYLPAKAAFVVRRNAEIIHSEVITLRVTPVTKISTAQTVASGDQLFFELVTLDDVHVTTRDVSLAYRSQGSWTASASDSVNVLPQLSFETGASGDLVMIVFRDGTRIAESPVVVRDGVVSASALAVTVNADQRLAFEFSTAHHGMASRLKDKGFVALSTGSGEAATVAARRFHIDMPESYQVLAARKGAVHFPSRELLFGHTYRGWGVAGYNGNGEYATQPIHPNRFKLSTDKNAYKDRLPDAYVAFPQLEAGQWESIDPHWAASGTYLKSTRRGLKHIDVPAPEAFMSAAGVVRLPRYSTTASTARGGGFVLSVNRTTAQGHSVLDNIDLNGDRYPDVVGGGSVQFTRPDGSLDEVLPILDTARRSLSKMTTVSFGGGISDAQHNDKGVLGKAPDRPANLMLVPAETGGSYEDGSLPDAGAGLNLTLNLSGTTGTSDTTYDLIDINGDGLPDRVRIEGGKVRVCLNLGYAFADEEEIWGIATLNKGNTMSVAVGRGWSTPGQRFSGGENLSVGYNDAASRLLDLNGDGLPDFVQVDGNDIKVAFNTGAGFLEPVNWGGALSSLGSIEDLGIGNAFNGITRPFRARKTLSDGTATSASVSANVSVAVTVGVPPAVFDVVFKVGANVGKTVSQPTVSLLDVNGNGLVDMVRSSKDSRVEVALNQTGRTNLLREVKRPLGGRFSIDYERSANSYEVPHSRWLMSGITVFDGVTGDPVASALSSDYQRFSYIYDEGRYDRFEREFLGWGRVVTQVHDTAGVDLAEIAASPIYRQMDQRYLNDSFYEKGLLSAQTLYGGNGSDALSETRQLYTLRDLDTLHAANVDVASKHGLALFPTLDRTEHVTYEVRGSQTHLTEYRYDRHGNVVRLRDGGDRDDDSDDVWADIIYAGGSGSEYPECAARHMVGIPEVITMRESDGASRWIRQRRAEINCYTGRMTQIEAFESDGRAAQTNIVYDGWGNLKTIQGAANLHGERVLLEYEYDSPRETHVRTITNRSFGYGSTATWNDWGQPLSTTDINGHSIVYSYDGFDRLATVTGPKEAGSGTPTIQFHYNPYVDLTQPPRVSWARTEHHDQVAEGSGTIDTLLFTDGLKRVLQTKKDAAVQGVERMLVSGPSVLDAFGRPVEQYYPFSEAKEESPQGNTTLSRLPSDAVEPTRTVYDERDRVTSTTLPDGSTTHLSYGVANDAFGIPRLATTVTDALKNRRTSFTDVRGRITTVREFLDNAALDTRYVYDRLGQITDVYDAAGHHTHVSYDRLGRRTAIDNPDTGEVRYEYDLAGNLTHKKTPVLEALGKEIIYAYDHTRLIQIIYPLHLENNVTYLYGAGDEDRARNQVGRIKQVKHGAGTDVREYDELGNVAREVRTLAQGSQYRVFSTEYGYDSFGRLLSVVLPDGEELAHGYDAGGNLAWVRGTKGGRTTDYVQSLHYDHFEQRTQLVLGNGIETRYTYDPLTRRLCVLESGRSLNAQPRGCHAAGESAGQKLMRELDGLPAAPAGQFQNLHYIYDAVGNIRGMGNAVQIPRNNEMGGPAAQGFEYDGLYRLTEAYGRYHESSRLRHEYDFEMQYDAIHNITQKTQAHRRHSGDKHRLERGTSYDWSYAYTGDQPHAPTHIGERTFSYDANGNQTGWTHDHNGTRRIIKWDEADRVRAIRDPGQTLRFLYDDQGQRTQKRGQHGETVYVNQYYTLKNGAITSKHIYAGNTRVASRVITAEQALRVRELEELAAMDFDGSAVLEAYTLDITLNAANDAEVQVTIAEADAATPPPTAMTMQIVSSEPEATHPGRSGQKNPNRSGNHPGRGVETRSDRANEVAQNTCKNKHLLHLCDAEGSEPAPVQPGEPTQSGHPVHPSHPGQGGGSNETGGGNTNSGQGADFLYYYHPDHLGSTAYVTDEKGEIYEHIQYFPFGETWVQQASNTFRTPYLYTSKELDPETGLYYFGARYYDPRTSVWQSADPILSSYLDSERLFDSRNFGVYSYAGVNPVKYIDPDGNLFVTSELFRRGGPDQDRMARYEFYEKATATALGGQAALPLVAGGAMAAPEVALAVAVRNPRTTAFATELAAAEVGMAGLTAGAVWKMSPLARGQAIESHLAKTEYKGWFNIGQLNNGKFPLVDFQKGNTLVSLKSVETTGKGWLGRMQSHIDDLASSGATVNGNPANMVLDLRVQPGGAQAASELIDYGRRQNVTVIIKELE